LTRPPPIPLYPTKYDSDETLYLVYNTSESALAKDNPAWSDEVEIRPNGEDEIWAENGFANVGGELFYYNSVEKKEFNGKQRVFKFKECVRNLGGETSKYNYAGEKVRGFVVAEHHNQIVDAIINIQEFIGNNFSSDTASLDYKIRNLENVPVIFDDFNCPDVSFTFNIIDDNPATGILASYLIEITGAFTNFKLDFGDGNYTSSILQGTHVYAPNSNTDPVLTIYNNNCSTTFTPTNRTTSIEPVVAQFDAPLEIPIPPPPEIPPILITPFIAVENKYNIPPIVFPCLDVGTLGNVNIPSGIYVNVPSFISISPINIPSHISISPINIPSQITIQPSQISITPIEIDLKGALNSYIQISPIHIDTGGIPINIPSVIRFENVPDISATISGGVTIDVDPLVNAIANNYIQINTNDLSNISIPVVWGTPPPVTVIVQCPTSSGTGLRAPEALGFNGSPSIDATIEVDTLGIPSVINIVAPNIPPLSIDTSNIPTVIKLESISGIPEQIQIVAPNVFIPSEIKLISDTIVPSSITLDASGVPSVITIESNIPQFIGLKIPEDFPKEIKLDASEIPKQIQVVGIPPVIELKGNVPSTIQLVMPEKPEIEMVYKGAPIDVKIQLDISKVAGDGQNLNCVAIVPCK
jgi:PKD repeat protein